MKNTNLNKIVLVENPLIGKNINVYPILAFLIPQNILIVILEEQKAIRLLIGVYANLY